MKITTLERYIRYTAIPYTELLDRARKGGLKVKIGDTIVVSDKLNKTIDMIPHNKKNLNEGMAGFIYNYDR